MAIGIGQLAYELPQTRCTVDELRRAGLVRSEADVLREFGFESVYIDHDQQHGLRLAACRRVLEAGDVDPDDVEALLVYQGMQSSEVREPEDVLEFFRYPAARLRAELGLATASALGMSQQGCSGLLTSIELAARLLPSSPRRAVLCVAGDSLPPQSMREIMFNAMSDAAAALLVEKDAACNRIVHVMQRVHPYYWDSPIRQDELMASYFPIAQRTILECMDEAGLALSDIRWLVPHNVSRRSWEILARLLAFPEDRIWTKNIPRVGHTISCDHVVNLVDMAAEGALRPGDKLLLFTFGFGASWSCLVLEH